MTLAGVLRSSSSQRFNGRLLQYMCLGYSMHVDQTKQKQHGAPHQSKDSVDLPYCEGVQVTTLLPDVVPVCIHMANKNAMHM